MARIMNVFYGADCLPYKDKERQVHYPIVSGSIFNGSSVVDKVRFYVKELGNVNDITWVSNAKRADGLHGYKILEPTYDSELDEFYVELSLSQWYTAKKGDLYISLDGYQGGVDLVYDSENQVYTSVSGTPVIQATGVIKITISYSVQMSSNEGSLPTISVQEALALVSSKLDKDSPKYFKVIDNITNINTQGYVEFLNSGDIVYCKTNKSFYLLSESSENLVATLNTFGNTNFGGETNFSGNATFGGDTWVNDANGGEFWVGNDKNNTDEPVYTQIGRNIIKMHHGVFNGELVLSRDNSESVYEFVLDDTYHLLLPYENGTFATKEYVQGYTYSKTTLDSDFATITYANGFAKSLEMSIDSNYDLVIKLKDNNGNVISTQDVDLPLESIVTDVEYYDTYEYQGTTYEKVIVIELATTSEPTIVPVGDLISGLVEQTNSAYKLYGTTSGGSQTTLTYGTTGNNTIVQRDSSGFIKQTNTPLNNDDVPNKQYVDGIGSLLNNSKADKTTTIAGNSLSANISAQTLTDSLVFMNNTTDIEYVMED